jgi:Zn finger protein HypA/HybF involved in hydrogenase expression
MVEMHCGMCEYDWLGDADSYLCPSCGSDETELLSEARTHNEFVQTRDRLSWTSVET